MSGLARFLIASALLTGLVYAVFFVDFGGKTIYRHVVGITRTSEARTLGTEVEHKIDGAARNVSRKISSTVAVKPKPAAADTAPLDSHTDKDREALRRLLHEKNK
jgi:sensor domain CHASE-containing protein